MRRRTCPASRIAAVAESVRSPPSASAIRPGAIRVVERELAEHACTEHRDVLPVPARGRRHRVEIEQRADVDVIEPLGRGDEEPRAVRRREDQRLGLGLARHLARRVAEVEAGDRLEPPLAGELRRALRLRELARLVDLGAAEDTRVAGRERLRHRRGRAQDVDDDPDRCRRPLVGSEGDVDEHAARLVAMSTAETRLPTCYRHPDRETGLSCSECGRPICTECMTAAPVGLRCPDHAGTGRRVAPPRIVRRTSSHVLDSPVTKILIALNVGVYLITAVQGNGLNNPGGSLYVKWIMYGPLIDHGDWWRLITPIFLHGFLLHLGLNMLALWWIGRPVESYLGTARFVLLYFVAGLAGSAGALVQAPLSTRGRRVGRDLRDPRRDAHPRVAAHGPPRRPSGDADRDQSRVELRV